jgi:hypothetical protein
MSRGHDEKSASGSWSGINWRDSAGASLEGVLKPLRRTSQYKQDSRVNIAMAALTYRAACLQICGFQIGFQTAWNSPLNVV